MEMQQRMWSSSSSFALLFLLCLSSHLFRTVTGVRVQYGPSLEFLTEGPRGPLPLQSTLRGDRGPGSVTIKELNLDAFYPHYSVTLPLTNESDSAPVSRVHPQGEFKILAPQDYGIMIVIQTLRLRTRVFYSQNEDVTATFLKCQDFIRFTAQNQTTAQVCGHVSKASNDGSPSTLLGPRMFITPQSQLTVSLYIERDFEHEENFGWHETIAAEIVATAFKACPKDSFFSQQWKRLTGSNKLRSCSPSEERICVHPDTFCDGVGNCGVRGPLGHIGFDEENCYSVQQFPPPSVSTGGPSTNTGSSSSSDSNNNTPYIGVNKPYTPPTTGSVVSPIYLIMIFSGIVLLIFGACTWLARANEKKFQHTMYRFSTMRTRGRNRNRNNDRARNTGGGIEEGTPTAPPASNVNTLRIVGDDTRPGGEQPPAYEHLFPPTAPPPSTTPSSTNSLTNEQSASAANSNAISS